MRCGIQTKQALLAATDHLGLRPCLYAYQPGKYFIFANYMTPFRVLCPSLTLNKSLFAHFALDSLPEGKTCYREVNKILPAHQLIITSQRLQQNCYWQLKKQSSAISSYRTRDDYYQAFRELFIGTVQQYLRSPYSIAAQISGGLDSSAVASVAAKILAEKNEILHGFTAIPRDLEGPSFKNGWHYHEMPQVQTILQQYSNISHTIYQTLPMRDSLQELTKFYPFIDQPYRNVFNFDWIIACLVQTAANNGRQVLSGQYGNATISFAGYGIKHTLYRIYKNMGLFFKPSNLFDGYFNHHNADFLQSRSGKQILRSRGLGINDWNWMRRIASSKTNLHSSALFMVWGGNARSYQRY